MWIERKDKSTLFTVLRNFYICGCIFNFFAFFGCAFTQYNDYEKNRIKKISTFNGLILNSGVVLFGIGCNSLINNRLAVGIPLTIIGLLLLPLSLYLYFRSKRNTAERIEDIKNYISAQKFRGEFEKQTKLNSQTKNNKNNTLNVDKH